MDNTRQTVKTALTVACVDPVCWAEVPFCEELWRPAVILACIEERERAVNLAFDNSTCPQSGITIIQTCILLVAFTCCTAARLWSWAVLKLCCCWRAAVCSIKCCCWAAYICCRYCAAVLGCLCNACWNTCTCIRHKQARELIMANNCSQLTVLRCGRDVPKNYVIL